MEYKLSDGTSINYNSIAKKPIETYTDTELRTILSFLWSNSSNHKADLTMPFANIIMSELNDRKSKSQHKFNFLISLFSLLIAGSSFYFTFQNISDTNKIISLSEKSLDESKTANNVFKQQVEQSDKWMKSELQALNSLKKCSCK